MSRFSVALAACGGLLLVGAGAAGAVAPNLEEPVNIDVGRDPTSIAVGDLNGDGKLDVVTGQSVGDVRVALGTGAGKFAPAQRFDVGGGVESVALADFTGDAKLDVVAAANQISLLPGDGRGGLGVARSFAVPAGPPRVVAVADFDRDGRSDVATASLASDALTILLGDGGGRLSVSDTYEVPPSPSRLAVSEFNGDGKLDLATEGSVLLGDGDGRFGAPRSLFGGGGSGSGVAAGDLNRDGKPDLAVTADGLSVFLGDGAGFFLPPVSFLAHQGPAAVVTAAFRTGVLDLAVINNLSGDLSLFQSDGSGGFLGREDVRAGRIPSGLAAGDANRDGREDLLVSNLGSDDVSVLLNAGMTPVVKEFRLGRRTFRATSAESPLARSSAKRGSSFRYSLSKRTAVRIVIERAKKGRFSKGKCRRPRRSLRRKRRCTRWVKVGTLRRKGEEGENRHAFNGRIRGKKLRRGRYRATIVAKDRTGRKSLRKRARFRIVRR